MLNLDKQIKDRNNTVTNNERFYEMDNVESNTILTLAKKILL